MKGRKPVLVSPMQPVGVSHVIRTSGGTFTGIVTVVAKMHRAAVAARSDCSRAHPSGKTYHAHLADTKIIFGRVRYMMICASTMYVPIPAI